MAKRLEHRTTNHALGRPIGFKPESLFVGRDRELGRLAASLALAAEGQGGTVFLTGQLGVGKTRLAREALVLAKKQGFTVLEGHAFPMEAGLAYAPIVDAFGPPLRSLDPPHLATLVNNLPSLGRLFEGLNLPPPEPLHDPALERTRLFEAVSRLFERLICEAPLVLFLDDLHWADPATLELLHYLAHGLGSQRALLLATYTADDLDTSPGLQGLVESLQRAGLVEEIFVRRLERGAVDKLVQGVLGGHVPGGLLALIEARAEGTPLFVEALISTLIDSGSLVPNSEGWDLGPNGASTVPPSIRRLILSRLRRLTPGDRRIVDLIAIMGDATSHPILRAASGLAEDELIEALRRLRAAGLVSETVQGSDLTYSITHALVQEVSYDELPEAARRRAHLAAIAALHRLKPDDVSRLARHYRAAGPEADPGEALAVLVAAGEQSRSLYANEEAARHYSAALAIVRERRNTEGGGHSTSAVTDLLPWLLERLGETWEQIGEGDAAVQVWNEALAERARAGDATAESRLHRQLALLEWARGHFDVSNRHLQDGMAVLADRQPCQELADLHYTRHRILSRIGDLAGVAETAAELLSIAGRLTSPRAEAEANLAAFVSRLSQSDVAGARERALHALGVAELARDLAICCRAHSALASIAMLQGDHKTMRYHAERGLALVQRLGGPTKEVWLRQRLAYANFMSGAWNDSDRCSIEAIVLARRIGHPRDLAYALAWRAVVLALRGNLPEAEACIAEANTTFHSEPTSDRALFGLVQIAESVLALERGKTEHALAIVKIFARSAESGASSAGLPLWYLPMALMLRAETLVRAGDPEGGLETAHDLIDLGPAGVPYLAALAFRAEGLARQALGQRGAALTCFERAHEIFTSLEMPFEAGRSLLEQATLASVARPEIAVRAAQQSLAAFERLGAQLYAKRARSLLREFGISPLSTRQPRLGEVPVSDRELEIARLVAQGLTNAEIARRLVISSSTVHGHLHRIFARLGVGSRTALARLVIEAGLLLPETR